MINLKKSAPEKIKAGSYIGKLTLKFNGECHQYDMEVIGGEIEDIALTYAVDSPLFQYFEKLFEEWYEDQPVYVKDMYESEEAIYYKKGAIIGGIEILDEYIRENTMQFIDLDKEGYKLDIECAYQP